MSWQISMALTLTATINAAMFSGRSSVGFHAKLASELD